VAWCFATPTRDPMPYWLIVKIKQIYELRARFNTGASYYIKQIPKKQELHKVAEVAE
jgi:hypothetical protein